MTSEHPVLKPCPFCGSSNVAPALIGYHRVGYCKNCGAKGPHRDSPTPVEAIAAWNTRPTPSPDVADVSDQLRKEAAMLREIAKSEARGVDWRENLGASAEWLTQAAATITALSAELARKDKALEEARAFIADPAKHRYWGAGEPDCPREIKAGNGELHTLRCKVCGQDSPRDQICRGGFDAG